MSLILTLLKKRMCFKYLKIKKNKIKIKRNIKKTKLKYEIRE